MSTETPTPAAETKLHIVAIGSSFAAGPGIPPQIDGTAMRSGQNYAHILSSRLGARLTDLTVSGATLDNLLSQPQKILTRSFPPQISQLPPDADVVTITAGGNDLNYIGAAMRDAMTSSLAGRLVARFLPLPKTSEEGQMAAEQLAERMLAVVDAVYEKAPGCRVLLVEYLTLFGPYTQPGRDVALSASQIQRHRDVAAVLQRAYAIIGERRPAVGVVPIAELSREHGVGSEEPWVEGFRIGGLVVGKASFHPNAEGMRRVAGELERRLR